MFLIGIIFCVFFATFASLRLNFFHHKGTKDTKDFLFGFFVISVPQRLFFYREGAKDAKMFSVLFLINKIQKYTFLEVFYRKQRFPCC